MDAGAHVPYVGRAGPEVVIARPEVEGAGPGAKGGGAQATHMGDAGPGEYGCGAQETPIMAGDDAGGGQDLHAAELDAEVAEERHTLA